MRFVLLILGSFLHADSLHLATGVVLELDTISICFTINEWYFLLALVQHRDSCEKSEHGHVLADEGKQIRLPSTTRLT